MILIKSFFPGILHVSLKLIYTSLNERDKVRECYSCLKLMIQAHLFVGFFRMLFIKRASHKLFYLYINFLQSSTILKKKKKHGVSCD